MVLQFHVLVWKGVGVEDRAPRVSPTPACDFAVEDLAEDVEEGQKLLHAAHGAESE